jgi:urease accessory protein
MRTDINLARLRLLQLFDSQFPVGAFAHSGGLETYAQEGAGLAELRELLRNQIDLGWGRLELSAASVAWTAAADADSNAALARLSAIVHAYKIVPAVRDASEKMGRRTLKLLKRLHPGVIGTLDVDPPHQPVVIGAAGRRLDLPVRDLLLSYAHSLTVSMLTAATRCMPVSPDQTQELLIELQPLVVTAVERTLRGPQEVSFTCTPALDVRCQQQTLLRTRLFQS